MHSNGGGVDSSMITARISILNLARGNYMLESSNGELGRNTGGVLDPLAIQGRLVDWDYSHSTRYDMRRYGL